MQIKFTIDLNKILSIIAFTMTIISCKTNGTTNVVIKECIIEKTDHVIQMSIDSNETFYSIYGMLEERLVKSSGSKLSSRKGMVKIFNQLSTGNTYPSVDNYIHKKGYALSFFTDDILLDCRLSDFYENRDVALTNKKELDFFYSQLKNGYSIELIIEYILSVNEDYFKIIENRIPFIVIYSNIIAQKNLNSMGS